MNREKRHKYLVMGEKIHKKSKREIQRLLARKNMPISKSINDLEKAINKLIGEG